MSDKLKQTIEVFNKIKTKDNSKRIIIATLSPTVTQGSK
tara:strand:- start:435 stop:551 length:117 start_codon:yes stop_codon:yes gene_type:complete